MPTNLVTARPPQTDEELFEFVRTVWGFVIPRTKVCPTHVAPFTAFADAFFCRSPVAVWVGSRGFGGKSVLLSLLALTKLVCHGIDITVLGGSGEQSKRVIDTMARAWSAELAPRELLASEPGHQRINLKSGVAVQALTASQKSVRGPHPVALLVDECLAGDTRITTPTGWRRIDALRDGDLIEGPYGPTRVNRVLYKGIRKTVVVETEDGRKLTCTPEHLISIDGKWGCAAEISAREEAIDCLPALRAPNARSLRDILARPAKCYREGQSTSQGFRSIRTSSHRMAAGTNAPVVSGSTTVKVTSVTEGPWVPVWDLMLDDPHAFYAEGMLVHNCDELDMRILAAALGQPMSQKSRFIGSDGGLIIGPRVQPHTVLSSTHQYPNGPVTWALKEAVEKGWWIYSWCYKESSAPPDGWLSTQEIERKRQELPAETWRVEIELQEPAMEGRAIQTEAVERMFDEALGRFKGADGEYIEIEPPQPDARYVHGSDWAKEKDFTAIGTLRVDTVPMRLVAFQRMRRLPWPVMVKRLDERVRRYEGPALHDNTGLGNVIQDYVEAPGITGENLVGRVRQDIFSEYIAAIERDEIKAPMIEWMFGEHKFVTVADLYKTSGHPPDSFVAAALAYRAYRQSGTGSILSANLSRTERAATDYSEIL